MKHCILIVAFGTSTLNGYENQFQPFIRKIEENINIPTFIGFTSERIIKKLQDERILSFEEKIKEIKDLGYEEIILLKLVLSDGKENRKIEKVLEDNKNNFKKIIKTKPILEYKKTFIDTIFEGRDNTVFISHGREDDIVDSISEEFKKEVNLNYKNLSFLSLNFKEEADDIIKSILKENTEEVVFKPLLLTKGYHFEKDIYSDKQGSFKSRFTENKIRVKEINFGLLEDKKFLAFSIENLKNIIRD